MELPVITNRFLDDGTKLFVFNYRDVSEDDLRANTTLTPEELTFVDTFANWNRRKEWIAVRHFLQNQLDMPGCVIEYDENGGPHLTNPDKNISISHSSGLAAVIISDSAKVGIDIEVKTNKVLRILNKYLSQIEMTFLDKKFRTNHALICWAAKECAYKMFALRGINFAENMRVKPFRLNFNGNVTVKLFTENGLRDYTLNYEQHKDFVLVYGAVAS